MNLNNILFSPVDSKPMSGKTSCLFVKHEEAWATFPNKRVSVIGIDPGRNCGITTIMHGTIKMESFVMRAGAWEDYARCAEKLSELYALSLHISGGVIIEGASYGDKYGQVGLAMVRWGHFTVFNNSDIDVLIVPPRTIRKVAFGNGKLDGTSFFPGMNKNGVASFGCALYAISVFHPDIWKEL